MTWSWVNRWWRRPDPAAEESTVHNTAPDHGLDAARSARRQSEEALAVARDRDPAVRAAGARLRNARQVNGFAADIRAAMRSR